MSGMPIYSQVVPKSQHKARNGKQTKERPQNLPREFDPLNYNHGGNFQNVNPTEGRERTEKKERKKEEPGRTRKKTENEGKVEAYLRQNQVSMRQQQRHSVRQAEHRLNLRSLPVNEVAASRGHDRTPTERRLFPGERDGAREHRRERERDRDNDFDGTPLSPVSRHDRARPVRKSSSAHKVAEPTLSTDKRRFFCREWVFQKIAHCLEQRPASKTCGTLILGEAGCGKTALCAELSSPGPGPQARQQRALHRRLLARHLLQSHTESSLRPGEFVRSLAMQILSHGLCRPERRSSPPHEGHSHRDNSEQENFHRFGDLSGDDGEESSKPLLADSEDQRTDEEERPAGVGARRNTMRRIHERGDYFDAIPSAPLSQADVPEILPRANVKMTNPFLEDQKDPDYRLYENHENVFLRNVSQRQSKESRNSRLIRQSSEPLNDKKPSVLQKSLSTEQKNEEEKKVESSPPKSRIPVANFRYPNKSDLKLSSAENSPHKRLDRHNDEEMHSETGTNSTAPETSENLQSENSHPENQDPHPENQDNADVINSNIENANNESIETNVSENKTPNAVESDIPEYQNILQRELIDDKTRVELEVLLEKKRSQNEDVPPPIPSLPVSPRTLIANAYYEKLLAEPEIQQALLPQNLEKNPDECFKKALLFPLLEIDPPKQCLFLLVDAIDEGLHSGASTETDSPSTSVAELLSRHQHLLPSWLLLVLTARRHRPLSKMFTGFRKIVLDELARAHVSADVQRYVLARLDAEPRLRARVSSEGAGGGAAAAAAALDHLRIKSDGCLLYLEKVLDGVADGFIALREIREIPGTLNGLYLWLAQRLFHGRRFSKVRLLLDVLLAARCGVTEEMLYKCLLTKEYSVTREDFNRRLHLLKRIVVMERDTGHIFVFHPSFAAWLVDVKHCTRRYLCCPARGHAALAMYHTLLARPSLTVMEIHNYVYHMTQLEQHLASQKKTKDSGEAEVLDLHTLILLWVLDSGCDLQSALKRENDGLMLDLIENQHTETKAEIKEDDTESIGKETHSEATVPLEKLVPELGRWTGDARALTELLTLKDAAADAQTAQGQTEDEADDPEVEEPVDPDMVFELATKGDEDALAALLKRHPELVLARDASGGTALHAAARAGRARAAAALAAAGAALAAADCDGWSPLRAAAWAGHPEVVDVLLEYGCDVDCVDADNRTALRAAAWSGHAEVVSRLLAAGATPDKADAEGRTPLMAAAYMGHADIVRALLNAGAKPDHRDLDGRTALSVAALSATGADVASLLLERGATVDAVDRDGATPLLVAAMEGHTEVCEVLLEGEADVEATDYGGRTALWGAAGAGHAAPVRLLLFWGASVDTMDAEGRTVLSAAAAQGNVEVVRQLLDRGLDEHHRDNSGWTPLHYAAFEGHIEVCEALLEAGARVDEADNDGKGPLLLAAAEGHARLAARLLDRWAAPPDQRAIDGKTALRLAALEGHAETVEVLVSRGADVDSVDADRRSTLYVSALDGRLNMARLLLRAGASPHAPDTEGRTPLHVAAWQGHTEMVNLLVKVGGACVESRDVCSRSALHAAAWRGRAGAARALLRLGADPAARCSQGATPLGIAAQEGHEECVLILLQHGADPLQADHCGRTPAAVAWRAGHGAIARLLERAAAGPGAPAAALASLAPLAPLGPDRDRRQRTSSPDQKRRSVHSSSTKSSSVSHEPLIPPLETITAPTAPPAPASDKANRTNLSLSFAQQVARMGRRRRDKDRDGTIPEHQVLEKDAKLRSYEANERDADLRGYVCERDRRRDEIHGYTGYERDNMSPLYASPPRSPISDICSPTQPNITFGTQPQAASTQPAAADTDPHFNRDTHMRIILGRENKPQQDRNDSKSKRNGIVTNPAMRLVANVRNGLDNAAANIRRTGVALAASASSANPVVKTNAFQWRKETPL